MVPDRGQRWRNNKTGDIYVVTDPSVINSTNGQVNGQRMVSYHKNGETQNYVREYDEFLTKFTFVR